MVMEGEKKTYISTEELQKHNLPSDLRISIQGKVYDVTHWAKDHPGGDLPLLNLAGQDVTDAFVAYHPGTAWRHLDRFYVGNLTDYRVSEVSKDYRRLVTEFSKQGLFEKKGHGALISLCFVIVMFSLAVYGVMFTNSTWAHLASGASVGFLWMQAGWMAHDSSHYLAMRTARLNRFHQVLIGNCLTGLSIAWWKRIHNAHHIACNNLEFDPEVQHIPLFAVSSKLFNSITSHYYERKMTFDKVSRFLVSYQHWTFYPVTCFARINLHAQSILLLVSKKKVPNRGQEILGIVVFWLWYPLLVSCLPNRTERVMFVVASLVITGIQQVQFCLNHFSSTVYVGRPTVDDWFEKQTMGTLNISCSPWMDWFHGGLQFQTERHLFPRLPRSQLRRISPLVKDLCKKHKLHYAIASFWEANRMTINTLKTAALQAREFENPIPKNLVWEAVNTNG